jgi:deoxycytidylate deaminase
LTHAYECHFSNPPKVSAPFTPSSSPVSVITEDFMGVSLWSDEGYLLAIQSVKLHPVVPSEQSPCTHEIRKIILKNNRRVSGTTLCCSRTFVCSVCYTFIANSGVSRLLFPIYPKDKKWLDENKKQDVFALIREQEVNQRTKKVSTGLEAQAQASAEAKTGTESDTEAEARAEVQKKLDEALALILTTPLRMSFGNFQFPTVVEHFKELVQLAESVAWNTAINPDPNSKFDPKPRGWFYMLLSLLVMLRSEDRNGVRVGSVAVDENDALVGIGYNAYPRGVEAVNLPADASFIVHAEQNLLLFRSDYKASKLVLYSTRMPCDLCWPLLPDYVKAMCFWELPIDRTGVPKLKYEYPKPAGSSPKASLSIHVLKPDSNLVDKVKAVFTDVGDTNKHFWKHEDTDLQVLSTYLMDHILQAFVTTPARSMGRERPDPPATPISSRTPEHRSESEAEPGVQR